MIKPQEFGRKKLESTIKEKKKKIRIQRRYIKSQTIRFLRGKKLEFVKNGWDLEIKVTILKKQF